MIKRTLIACYLVLCAYFSFAQGGEVVLEIPMDLKSSFIGGSGYHGYLIENQEKNKYALLARDGSKVYVSLINSQFKLEKNMEFPDLWDSFSSYYNFITGYFEGTKYNFVLGDKRLRKFVVMSIDSITQQATKVALEINMDKDNNDFINGITVNGKCYLLFAKKAKSILDFYEIKNDFQVEKIEFDLSKDFSGESSLHKLFKAEQGFHAISHINPSQPLNLFSTFSPNKLYTDNNQVVLQIGKEKKIITFDFEKRAYQLMTYKLPSFSTPIEGEVHNNSLIYKDKLYQVNAHKRELVLSVTDLANGNIIKEHRMIGSNDKEGEPNLKNSPYYQDENAGGYAKSEIDNSKQFLKKLSNTYILSVGGISIAINELANQRLYVMIGSITYKPAGGSGGGGMMMATGSMSTPGGNVPNYSYVPIGGGVGSGYVKTSYYIDTMLDLNTSEYIKTNTIDLPFHHSYNQVRWQIAKDPDSYGGNILKIPQGLLFAYYVSTKQTFLPTNKKFIFKVYQEKTK